MPASEIPNLDFVAGLFDMDGTLTDSTALVEREWSAWAKIKGLDPDVVAHGAHGVRTEDVIRQYFPLADLNQEMSEFFRLISGIDQTAPGPIPGAVEFIRSLGAHPWAVITSATQAIARQRLTQCGFPEPPVLVGADDVNSGKPDPEGYLTAARRLGINPVDCLVFEDAPKGVEAAHRAQMRVVALETTHTRGQLHGSVGVRDFRELRVADMGGARLRLLRVSG
jgi:mannitol-1-/sugar-/sorbitol-6-phosphatase